MPSNDTDNGTSLCKPPVITPRSSSLQVQSGGMNGQEQAKDTHDTESTNSGSDGEKERVREKLKKTSITGIRSESHSRAAVVPEKSHQAEPAAVEDLQEPDSKMTEPDDKSEMSDESTSSQGSRKRSRDPEDDGEDVTSDVDNNIRPRSHTRKRSRELSDEPEGSEHRKGSPDTKSDDEPMAQPQPEAPKRTAQGTTTPPPVKMDEDTFASPSRKLDGRKRVREEGDADTLEKVKTKKPTVKESEGDDAPTEPSMGEPAGDRGIGNALSSPVSIPRPPAL